jgi:phage/plasmid-like protein (TIGR03299 family)
MHELDFSTGKAAIAYVKESDKPWHGLGQQVEHNQSIETWQKEAGLDWEAKRSTVKYTNEEGFTEQYNDKHVLYRSDNLKPLSVVGKDYKIVQPQEILLFFSELCKANNFEIETVGALREGRKVWALAKAGETSKIMDDVVAPYVMLATSYDGSMSTTAGYTAVRLCCNNTLNAALSEQGHARISVPHSQVFNASQAKLDLGLNLSAWEKLMHDMNRMADTTLVKTSAERFMLELLEPTGTMFNHTKEQTDKVRNSKTYNRVLELFNSKQLGNGQDAVDGTLYGLFNAFTQYIDHEHGRSVDSRLNTAWFGQGAKIKQDAFKLAMGFAD